ncbi:MAG: hypothetical protein ACRC11_08995, partial [Xenococcaceae cyanobacterium]
GASTLLQEAIKIDSSPEATDKLFAWLSTSEAIPLYNTWTKLNNALIASCFDEDCRQHPLHRRITSDRAYPS